MPPVITFHLDLFKHLGVPPNIDIVDQGCHEVKKKPENHCCNTLKFDPDMSSKFVVSIQSLLKTFKRSLYFRSYLAKRFATVTKAF